MSLLFCWETKAEPKLKSCRFCICFTNHEMFLEKEGNAEDLVNSMMSIFFMFILDRRISDYLLLCGAAQSSTTLWVLVNRADG